MEKVILYHAGLRGLIWYVTGDSRSRVGVRVGTRGAELNLGDERRSVGAERLLAVCI